MLGLAAEGGDYMNYLQPASKAQLVPDGRHQELDAVTISKQTSRTVTIPPVIPLRPSRYWELYNGK